MELNTHIHKKKAGAYVVSLDGRLDTDTHVKLKEELKTILTPDIQVLIFDMAKLAYVSSSGLGIIFQARKIVEDNNGIFIMTNLQPQIKKVFDIVKTLSSKRVFSNMEEVDKYLDTIQKKETDGGVPLAGA